MSVEATPTNALLPAACVDPVNARTGSLHRYAVGLGLLAWFLTDLSSNSFGTHLQGTVSDLGLAADAASIPGAVAGLTTTFAAFPMGWIADKVAPKQLLTVGLLLATAACALALLGSEAMFGIVALLVSIAAVLVPPVVVRLLQWLAHDLRGVCIGVVLALSGWASGAFYLLTYQLSETTSLGWRANYLPPLVATLLLAVLVMTTFRAPSTASEAQPEPTLPMGSMLHLLAAAIVLAAIAGGSTQLASTLLANLQNSGARLRYVTEVSSVPMVLTVVGATTAAFLYGDRARWLPRLAMGAASICCVGLVLAALAAGSALAFYSLNATVACGDFMFGAGLSACACWATENVRGLLTGALFAAKQLLGAILTATLFALSGGLVSTSPAWGLAVAGLLLCGWSVWHAQQAAGTLAEPIAAATPAA
jgi:predicted MFS family arabinose efflux permease